MCSSDLTEGLADPCDVAVPSGSISTTLGMDANTLLVALLDATEHYESDPRRARWDGAFLTFGNATGTKPGLLGDARGDRVQATKIDDLASAGWLRLHPPQSDAGVQRKFALTAEGRRHARDLRRAHGPEPADAVDMSWRVLQGRLAVFVDAYERAGAPPQGLPLAEGAPEERHIRALMETGYLEETPFGSDQRTLVKPTERALRVLRAWPSAETMARQMLDEVLAELDRRPEAEARSARTSLMSGGRDLLIEVFAAVIAKQSGLG